MARLNTTALVEQIATLAGTVPDAQLELDKAYNEAYQRVQALVEGSELGPDHPCLDVLMPTAMRISSYTIEASFLFSSTSERSMQLGLSLGALPLNAFIAARYGITVEHRDRIRLTVESIPHQ